MFENSSYYFNECLNLNSAISRTLFACLIKRTYLRTLWVRDELQFVRVWNVDVTGSGGVCFEGEDSFNSCYTFRLQTRLFERQSVSRDHCYQRLY